MKRLTAILLIFMCLPSFGADFPVGFWNLENFFDYFDGGTSSSDRDFSSFGSRHWNRRKFNAKIALVGKGMLYCSRECGGRMPLVFGVAEVENAFVLRRLCGSDLLRKFGWSYVHFDSPDPRGIDVGLLYCSDSLVLVQARALNVGRTRDILYVTLDYHGTAYHLFVNHHPSKYSGSRATVSGRERAMRVLVGCVDSLRRCGCSNIIAMGDFNDTPYGPAFAIADSSLVNAGRRYLESLPPLERSTAGTIRFRGNWELIDNFLVSDSARTMKPVRIPFLLQKDRTYPGLKPLRTYSGPRYIGGASDHLPIVLL